MLKINPVQESAGHLFRRVVNAGGRLSFLTGRAGPVPRKNGGLF